VRRCGFWGDGGEPVIAPQAACDYPTSGEEITWDGFRNIDRAGMLQSDAKPGNARYWWMEGTLERIFRDKGWKQG
jgi:hypothetical protein